MARTEIRGEQVEDESLTGDDVKNSSLSLDDLSQAALDQIEIQAGFDPTGTDLTATKIGDAIREAITIAGASASPGFSFGRSANVAVGTWLQIVGGVPSNRTGIPVAIENAELILVSVGNENLSTFEITIYEHDGDSINLTTLTTVSMINERTNTFVLSVAVTTGKQLAARLTNGAAKNVGVSLQLKGNS